jgi:hypothetical protein
VGTTWVRALDEYEARLDAQRSALDGGEAGAIAPFVPPVGLEPLPHALITRANDLLQQSLDLELELAGNLQAIKEDLAVVNTVTTSTDRPSTPLFVDLSA